MAEPEAQPNGQLHNGPQLNGPTATQPDAAANGGTTAPQPQQGTLPIQVRGSISADRIVKKGEPDASGDTVTDIFVGTDQFIVYVASAGSGDRGRLRYVLPDDYEVARQFRAKLTPIVGDLAFVGDVVAGLPDRGLFGLNSQYATLRRRTLDLMARAMQAAFEDQPDAALALVTRARDEVVSRRDSRNRMRYIFANAMALGAILALWLASDRAGLTLPPALVEARDVTPAAAAAAPTFRPLDVLTLGAFGAFFAVSAAINQVKVQHTISFWEMIYAGFVRVPIGVIAAGVVIFLISGGWILASISDAYRLPSLYLFGFLAGFSELFVPNALKQVEAGTQVKQPETKPGG